MKTPRIRSSEKAMLQIARQIELEDLRNRVRGYQSMLEQITQQILARPLSGNAPGIQAGPTVPSHVHHQTGNLE